MNPLVLFPAGRRLLRFALLAAGTMAVAAHALDFGVNTHRGGSATTNDQVAAVMKQRNFKTARMDLIAGQDQTAFRDQVGKIKANGGSVEVALQISYQWDNSCNQNLPFVEQDAYNQTAAAVNQVKDIVRDFELLNEVQLRPDVGREVPWNSAGTATAPYQGKPCVATITAVLRGMSRAIHDIGAASALPLRVILGVLGRDFGFLTFMRQNGVAWDVTGFHNYPHFTTASLLNDPWYGPGGPLAQLASFGKPVHFNEFNCGEIYDGGYENQAGQPVTEQCLKAMNKHLTDLKNQTIANIESIHAYELLDEPAKPAPENRFGLMYDLATPKVHLYVLAAFAGGTLSAQERSELTNRGVPVAGTSDTVVYRAAYSNYSIQRQADGSWLVASAVTGEGPDTLTNVRYLQFSDQTISLADLAARQVSVAAGWNMMGNSVSNALNVATAFGDATNVASVWKWNPATGKWAFYSPMEADGGSAYAVAKGLERLTTIDGGEGFWVNAKRTFTAQFPAGPPVVSGSFQDQTAPASKLRSGWNLISIADSKTPSDFNQAIAATTSPPGTIPASVTTLWAWDAASGKWYFYAPSLDGSGALSSYASSHGYLTFGSKTLGPTTGFWVNHP